MARAFVFVVSAFIGTDLFATLAPSTFTGLLPFVTFPFVTPLAPLSRLCIVLDMLCSPGGVGHLPLGIVNGDLVIGDPRGYDCGCSVFSFGGGPLEGWASV